MATSWKESIVSFENTTLIKNYIGYAGCIETYSIKKLVAESISQENLILSTMTLNILLIINCESTIVK